MVEGSIKAAAKSNKIDGKKNSTTERGTKMIRPMGGRAKANREKSCREWARKAVEKS